MDISVEKIYMEGAAGKCKSYINAYYEEMGRLDAQSAFERHLEFLEMQKKKEETNKYLNGIEIGLKIGKYVCCGPNNRVVDAITGAYV